MHNQRELRELQRWLVVPTLKAGLRGRRCDQLWRRDDAVSGGARSDAALQYGVSLGDVIEAVNNNNSNAGGSVLLRGDQGFVVRGIGLIRNLEDLGNIVVTVQKGTPVFCARWARCSWARCAQRHPGQDHNPDGGKRHRAPCAVRIRRASSPVCTSA